MPANPITAIERELKGYEPVPTVTTAAVSIAPVPARKDHCAGRCHTKCCLGSTSPLCSCADDAEVCLLGWFMPCCLFARTYRRAGFGSLVAGALRFCLASLLAAALFICGATAIGLTSMSPRYGDMESAAVVAVENCTTRPACFSNFEHCGSWKQPDYHHKGCVLRRIERAVNTSACEVPRFALLRKEHILVCPCLQKALHQVCVASNEQSAQSWAMFGELYALDMLCALLYSATLALVLGVYRRKIAAQVGAAHMEQGQGKAAACCVHALFFLSPCALCQEARAVDHYNQAHGQPVMAVNVSANAPNIFPAGRVVTSAD